MEYSKLTFITGNLAKVIWLKKFVDFPIEHQKIDLAEVQSLDIELVVKYKAEEAYKKLQEPVLIEDTSLVFNALGKLPGPLIKWFLQELGNNGLCQILDSFPDRSALASVMYGFYDGHTLRTFSAEKRGIISNHPRGEKGFGWDNVFIPQGSKKTWGEMDDYEQEETSMRAMAVKKLNEFLNYD